MSRFPKSLPFGETCLGSVSLLSLQQPEHRTDFPLRAKTAPLLLPVPPSTLCRRKCRFRDHVATLKGVKGNSGWGFSPAPAGRETDLLGRVVPYEENCPAYDIRSDGIGQFRRFCHPFPSTHPSPHKFRRRIYVPCFRCTALSIN